MRGPYRQDGEAPDAVGTVTAGLHNNGVNPSSVAVTAVAAVRAGLAPAAGYAERYAGLKNSNHE